MRARVSKEQELVRITLRLPKDLHQAIETRSKYFDRSLNYEIEAGLRASIKFDEILDAKTDKETLELVEKARVRYRRLRILRLEKL